MIVNTATVVGGEGRDQSTLEGPKVGHMGVSETGGGGGLGLLPPFLYIGQEKVTYWVAKVSR